MADFVFAGPHEPTSLTGRTVVVTGGASGMGVAHVRRLSELGANVVLADRSPAAGEALAAELTEAGRSVEFVPADVSQASDWERIKDAALAAFGGINGLVNNAGVVGHHRIRNTTRADWQAVLSVNLTGPFLGMQVLAPVMRDSGGGAIINISSAAGLDLHPDPSYTASKWGLRGLTKAAAYEMGPWGIRVNSIHPGYFDTPMNDFATPELIEAKLSLLAVHRAGQPWEVAALVAHLISDAGAFITGAEIAIDGGWTAGTQCVEARRPA